MQKYYVKNKIEAGIDECARGCLFGRTYAACVIWDERFNNLDPKKIKYIKDSKKLSAKRREEMYELIIANCADYSIQYGTEEAIDINNISNTIFDCMHRCIDNLKIKPDLLLVDGLYFKEYNGIDHITIINGDNTYYSIAAGSILAKVSHDRYIKELCNKHPELEDNYSLLSNKGYGTVKHIEGIKKNGITKYHRKTYGICKDYIIPAVGSSNIG